jgi:prepilin signal peptidase PulO-like enzyme (type II secretory pathway)
MNKKWKQNKLLLMANLLLPIIIMLVLILRFDVGIETIKGFIFFLILLYASNSDIQIREIENTIPVMVFITGFININSNAIPIMVGFALLITIPILFVSCLRTDSLGGGDIKLISSLTFLLGLYKGLFTLIIGLFLALVCTMIFNILSKNKKNKSFPLVPYLTIGSVVAYLI